jgi:pantothenate kinase type III
MVLCHEQLWFLSQNRLVIDGTCVTFDFVNENDKYLGGAIAPGLQLRYKYYMILARLPLLSLQSPEGLVGVNFGIHSFWSCKWFGILTVS